MELSRLYQQVQRRTEDHRWGVSSPEVMQHAGKYVGVYNQRIVGVGMDERAVAEEAAEHEHCDWEDIVVIHVPTCELLEIPH